MRITGRTIGFGLAALGIAEFLGLRGCTPYPHIAVVFNNNGAGAAARHDDMNQARHNAIRRCNIEFGGNCTIRDTFRGSSKFCVSYGLNARTVTPIIVQQSINYSGNAALDQCRATPNSVCRVPDFEIECNHD